MDRTATGDGRSNGHPGGNLMARGLGSVLVHSNAESKSVWEIAPIRPGRDRVDAEQPIAKARRPPVGRPERGGGRGETEVNRPAPGGGRRTTTEPQQTAFESLGGWDSPPGRANVYAALAAQEGQYHE
jgi:hypothetical protein